MEPRENGRQGKGGSIQKKEVGEGNAPRNWNSGCPYTISKALFWYVPRWSVWPIARSLEFSWKCAPTPFSESPCLFFASCSNYHHRKKFLQERNGCWAKDMLLEGINFSWQTALQKGVPISLPVMCVRTSISPRLCYFGTFHFVKLFVLSNMTGEKAESFLFVFH